MDDTDLIARVYPAPGSDGSNQRAKTAIKASALFVPPHDKVTEDEVRYKTDDRESTEPPEERQTIKKSKYDGTSYIEIRFSKIPRLSDGVTFGCSPNCIVMLSYLL